MKKRVLALIMSTAMIASVLTACGGGANIAQQGAATQGGTEQGTDAAAPAATGEVTDVALKVWCPQNQVDTGIILTAKQVKELQKRNAQLEEENLILKKAIAIFTPHSNRD